MQFPTNGPTVIGFPRFQDFRVPEPRHFRISSIRQEPTSLRRTPASLRRPPSSLRRPSTFLRRSATALRRSPTSIRRLLSPSASVLPLCANLLLPSASSLRTFPCVQFPTSGAAVIGFPRFQDFMVSGLRQEPPPRRAPQKIQNPKPLQSTIIY